MPKVDDWKFKMPEYPSLQSRDGDGVGPGRAIIRCGGDPLAYARGSER